MAVAGLPELRSDHAVVMARFARDLLDKMGSLTSQLETTLGPGKKAEVILCLFPMSFDGYLTLYCFYFDKDTSDLSIRIGLHSGPVS